MKYPRKFGYVWKKTESPKYVSEKNHFELSANKNRTPKNHLDRPLLKIQISDSKETIMVWYKNRNVQLPRLKNDSPQTSYILVTKLHHIMTNPLLQLPDHINCFSSILNEKDLWRLGQTWFFFHLKLEFYFFTFRSYSQRLRSVNFIWKISFSQNTNEIISVFLPWNFL